MHEPAAREGGRSTASAQQSHHLAAGVAAVQTAGAWPQNRRITADSFRALSARLKAGRSLAPAAAAPVIAPLPEPIIVSAPPPAAPVPPSIPDEPQSMADILSAVFGKEAASWRLPQAPLPLPQRPTLRGGVLRDLPPAPPAAPPPPESKPVVTATPEPESPSEPLPAPEPEPATLSPSPEERSLAVETVVETPSIAVETPPSEVAEPPKTRREPQSSLLRKRSADATDPFAEAQAAAAISTVPPVEIGEPDPQAGETAKSLLDIMSASTTVSQPQERALAADTLLRLIPRVPEKSLISLVERVAIMEAPPPMLVTRLIRDPRAEVAGPLLERASHIPDRDLITVINEGDLVKLRLIARRRHLSPALVDALIAAGDTSVLLTLVRNPGAAPSHEAFQALCDQAKIHHSLQAPLITRQDTPVPTAFELFWYLPPELRRFVLSRFLTDSENLNRILKIAKATQNSDARGDDAPAETPLFPERKRVDDLMSTIIAGDTATAAAELAELAQICEANALRIISDPDGEPLTIALKVIGMSRARFAEGIVALQQSATSTLRKDRNPAELQSIFDSMSFNKARVLLTYWDWLALKSGPYTRLAA
jgi:uncharacterized protein (DUF2336 family)